MIRITESDIIIEANSPALLRLYHLLLAALYQAGHLLTPDSKGVTSQLAALLQRHGLEHVQTHAHTLEYRAGTPLGQLYLEDVRHISQTLLPFLRQWTRIPEDYEILRQQALSEIQQPGFVATWNFLTAWGNTPPEKEQSAPLSREH